MFLDELTFQLSRCANALRDLLGWLQTQQQTEAAHRTQFIAELKLIMSAVTDFAAKVQANFDKLSGDLDSLTTEIKTLNDTIQTLQNSSGTLGPSDQAALDDISAKSAALAARADALVVPPVPPVPAPATT